LVCYLVHGMPLIVITLGPRETDNSNQKKTIPKSNPRLSSFQNYRIVNIGSAKN
jgi:hypothetical protein